MDQLLLDAKRLASRLREHSGSTDTLIDQAKNLQFKLDAMKQVKWMKDDQGFIKPDKYWNTSMYRQNFQN